MGLTLTHSGLILHESFSGDSCPTDWTEVLANAGTIVYLPGMVAFDAPANIDRACLRYDNDLLGSSDYVVRTKAKSDNPAGNNDTLHLRRAGGNAQAYTYFASQIQHRSYDQVNAVWFWAAHLAITAEEWIIYEFERLVESTDFMYSRAYDPDDMSELITGNGDFSTSTENYLYLGQYRLNLTTGWAYVDWIQAYEGNRITVTGLPANAVATVHDADGTLVSQATAVAGTATVDVAACDFNSNPSLDDGGFQGSVRVFEDDGLNRCLGVINSDSIWGGNDYRYTEDARVCRFVDLNWSYSGGSEGKMVFDANDGDNICLDRIEFPPPDPSIEWVDPAHRNGRWVSRHKYPNRELMCRYQVYGADKDELSDNLENLLDAYQDEHPIIEWRPEGWAESLFFDLVTPPISVNTDDWFKTYLRDNPYLNVVPNVEITAEALPFARGVEETILVAEGLGTNDNFEDNDTVSDFDDWVEATAGGGTVACSNDQFSGTWSCELATAGGGADSAQVTDEDYLPVDRSRHHNIKIAAKKTSGTVALDVDVACYNDAPALLGTLNMLVGDNVAATWEDPIERSVSTGVIHPTAEGNPFSFPAGTTQVKRTYRNDSAVAGAVVIDLAYFGESEYFTRECSIAGSGGDANRVENPATVVIPPDDLKGDVPAPCRLYASIAEDTPENEPLQIRFAYLGERRYYSDDCVLVLKPTNGASTTDDLHCIDQYYKTDAPEPLGDWTFETDMPICADTKGRYLPIVRCRYDGTAGDDATLQLMARLYDVSSATALTDYEAISGLIALDANNVQRWIVSGAESPGGESLGAFDVIDVPHHSLPSVTDDSDIVMQFELSVSDGGAGRNFDLDYLALVPIEYGYCHLHHSDIDSVVHITFDGIDYRLAYSFLADRTDSINYPITEFVGNVDIAVNPDTGMNYCIFVTDDSATQAYTDSPEFAMDMYLTYCPRYFLVPEE